VILGEVIERLLIPNPRYRPGKTQFPSLDAGAEL
jgi:hypothetical protein